MNRTKLATIFTAVGMSAVLLVPNIALAIDWNFTGFVRQEIAISITSDENENNRSTKPNLTRAVPTQTFGNFVPGSTNPADGAGIFSVAPATCNYWAGANGFGFTENPASLVNAATVAAGGSPCGPPGGIATAGGAALGQASNTVNMFNTRLEMDLQANNITDTINAYMKVRVYFDGTSTFSDDLGNHFEQQFYGDRGNLLELNSNSFMVDIPSLYFDYNKGPLWIRVGQQQIAWGEALFFRVFDVANGLDLRRHFFLDVAGEEYADERIASPGVRVSYTFSNGIEIDAFTQMFSPTLFPAQNNAYNLVTNGFHWDNRDEMDEAKNSLNYGMRVIWPVTDQLTVQVMAVNRRNPDGVVRWHDAPTTLQNGTPNPFCAGRTMALGVVAFSGSVGGSPSAGGADFSTLFGSPFGGTIDLSAQEVAMLNGPNNGGIALTRTKYTENGCGSFFAPGALGTNSAATWWQLSANGQFDPTELVEASIDLTQISRLETREGFGLPSERSAEAIARYGSERAAGVNTLDAFQTGFGALDGWITREFKRESIFGFGGNYIINTEDQNSFFNQMVLRGEMSYTPNKRFTDGRLSADWIQADEWTASVVAEKWHRWTDKIPGMFMVAEWMMKTESDLYGRHLSRNGTNPSTDLTGCAVTQCNNKPKGANNFNAVVFAFQQPFPDLIWRMDFAFLLDLEGGWLAQPGIRYRPSAHMQFDIYANIIQDGGDKGDDIMETIDSSDEVFVRATYFF